MNKRRIIMISISAAGAAAAAGVPLSVLAQAKPQEKGKGDAGAQSKGKDDAKGGTPHLDESDPQAVSLGYKHDTKRVDQAKFPKHEVSQQCGGCQFFQGAASQDWAPCTVFANKQVASKGWCSAWVKKSA